MKRRSKLFLLISGIIFTLGAVICLIGVAVSSSTGEQIYAAKIGEERGYTYDFSGIDKVKLSVTDADINIYGGCEKSYIEVINFNENLCSYTGNNAMVTFRETATVDSVAGVWESGLSFKGLRYILRPVPGDKQKTVNVYLSSDEHIQSFDIDLETGNVRVTELKTVTDYDISIQSGKIYFEDVTTESSIDIKAEGDMSTDVTFNGVSADIMTLNAKSATFTADEFVSASCEMKVTAGSATFDFVPKTELYTVNITTMGKLTVDGRVYPDKYTYPQNDAPAADPEDGEEVEPSALKIEGNDFSVNIETPAEPEDTADAE